MFVSVALLKSVIWTILFRDLAIFCIELNPINHFRHCLQSAQIGNDSFFERNGPGSLYAKVNHHMNTRIPPGNPLGIFMPRSTADVQTAVRCGLAANIPLIPKSGGHSSEGVSLGNPHAVVIDFNKMIGIHINESDQTARIEPGNVLGRIYWTLWSHGGFGVPIGACHTVGIAGFTLGGGIGFFSGLYGLGPDAVLEMEMVDADGGVRTVNAAKNADLYWALRGVGSGYIGIVTAFKYKMFPASDLTFNFITGNYLIAEISLVFQAWQKWLAWSLRKEPGVVSYASISGGHICVALLFIQKEKNVKRLKMLTRNLKEIFPPHGNMTLSNPSYIDLITTVGNADLIGNKIATYDDFPSLRNNMSLPVYQKIKSFYVKSLTYSSNEVFKISKVLQGMPKDGMECTWLVNAHGVRKHTRNETAFFHRRPYYYFSCEYTSKVPNAPTSAHESGLRWLRNWEYLLKFMDAGQTYQNDIDSDYKQNEGFRRYYGANLKELIRIKSKWDPNNYFKNPYSLPVAASVKSLGRLSQPFLARSILPVIYILTMVVYAYY